MARFITIADLGADGVITVAIEEELPGVPTALPRIYYVPSGLLPSGDCSGHFETQDDEIAFVEDDP